MNKVEFKIVKHLGIISVRTDYAGNTWTKEVNMVAWNNKDPKIDIREWNDDHTKMSKGITLTEDETNALTTILTLIERSEA